MARGSEQDIVGRRLMDSHTKAHRRRAPLETLSLTDWRQLRAELVWVYDGRIAPKFLRQSNYTPGQTAYLIRRGTVYIQTERGEVTVGSGNWVFPHEGKRIQEFSSDARILSIRFYWTWPGGQPVFDWDVARVMPAKSIRVLETAAKRLVQFTERHFPGATLHLVGEQSDLETQLLLNRRFLDWLGVYARILLRTGETPLRLGPIDPRLLQAIQVLDQHPFAAPFRERDLASRLGLSVSQLDRLFVRQFKISPWAYLEKRKIREAVDRVQGTVDPIKQIAIDFGFSTLAHFSSWFRNHISLSPRQLRQNRMSRFQVETLSHLE